LVSSLLKEGLLAARIDILPNRTGETVLSEELKEHQQILIP